MPTNGLPTHLMTLSSKSLIDAGSRPTQWSHHLLKCVSFVLRQFFKDAPN